MSARTIAFALLASVATQAFAYGTVSGKVVEVRVDRLGQGMVFFDQPIGGQPAGCVVDGYRYALSFDTNTHGGKSILAAVLAAKATDAVVSAIGTGQCSVYGGVVEDWNYAHVK